MDVRRLRQTTMMVFREIWRRPLRTVLSSAGIAFALAIIILGRFGKDAHGPILDLGRSHPTLHLPLGRGQRGGVVGWLTVGCHENDATNRGASSQKRGRFERADGGTILLDEIGELDPRSQVKLLRVLQEGEFNPVGSTKTEKVDVRVLAATHRDLAQEAVRECFRQDLLYRIRIARCG